MKQKNVQSVYAAYSKKKELRMKSSSGGLFSEFAEYVLDSGGVVYGVEMSSDCRAAQYARITRKEELERLRGSKYIQAYLGNTYQSVKNDLEEEKLVLFSGTGCYVNGLRKYLGYDFEKLICIDVVCHGTPSPKLWRKYVEYQEHKLGCNLIYVNFRNKDNKNWSGFEVKEVDSEYRDMYISRFVDPYFRLFVSNICLRPSCYSCTAKYYKTSDITIADFWGIDDVAPEMNDDKGISLVIVRTNIGLKLFETISNKLIVRKVTYEQGVAKNMSEYKSYDMPENRDYFFEDVNNLSFEKLCKKYLSRPLWRQFGSSIKSKLCKLWGGTINIDSIPSHEKYSIHFVYKIIDKES